MNIKKFLIGSAAAALMFGAMIAPAFAASDTAFLYNSSGYTCPTGATDTSSGHFGTVTMRIVGSSLYINVTLTGATANSTYDVWVNQDPNACPLSNPTFPAAIQTDSSGKGSYSNNLPVVSGATNFWISAVGGGQVLRSTALLSSAITGCTSVNTDRGQYTAAVVTTSNENITGEVNALGCDLGVYVPESATNVTVSAIVHDANNYGILNDGNVTVNKSKVYNIGNHNSDSYEPNGVQTGVGIYFDYYSSLASGSITNNNIYDYQKGGIVVNSSASGVNITSNTVTGAGQIGYTAQNGIQLGYGATGVIENNTVSGNYYTGPQYKAAGVLFYQPLAGTVLHPERNNLFDNQINFLNFGRTPPIK